MKRQLKYMLIALTVLALSFTSATAYVSSVPEPDVGEFTEEISNYSFLVLNDTTAESFLFIQIIDSTSNYDFFLNEYSGILPRKLHMNYIPKHNQEFGRLHYLFDTKYSFLDSLDRIKILGYHKMNIV